ncbi:hypothetical protein J2S11_003257 [Bacillus horti]|uniref:Transposase n=1 Tax=Caldalkalibacillus horti TaxID=77523 RepID=A0ABT9W257_9BACI|nr:hypothetical protein [Bacillus horti]
MLKNIKIKARSIYNVGKQYHQTNFAFTQTSY